MIGILLQTSVAANFFTSSFLNVAAIMLAMLTFLAASMQLARGYFLRILKKFTLRVAADIWWLLYIIIKDASIFLTVFIGLILFWPGVYQSFPIAVPFAQLAIDLFAIALVVMLIVDTEENRFYNNIITLLLLVGTILYISGIILVTEGPLSSGALLPTVSSSTNNIWGFANVYFNSINNPALSIYTFYVTLTVLCLCGLVAVVYSFKSEIFSRAAGAPATQVASAATLPKKTEIAKGQNKIGYKIAKGRIKTLLVLLASTIVVLVSVAIISHLWSSTLSTSRSNGEWTTFTLNYNNSRYQENSTITASNVGSLQQKWVIYTNSYVTSTPVVLNGSVYFGDWNGSLYSANVQDGSINWKVNLGHAVSSTPTLANGAVYVGFGPYGGTGVAKLAQKNGSVIWETELNSTEGGVWGSPTLFNGLIYIGTAGAGGVSGQSDNNASKRGQLFALNATTGKILWNFTAMIGNTGGAAVWSSASVDPNLNAIYFGTGNAYTNNTNSLYAYSIISLNATTGKLNWFYKAHNATIGDLDFGATPNLFSITMNGTTYQAVGDGSKDGYYYILNRFNGDLLGKYLVGTAGSSQGIIGLSGVIYPQQSNPEIFIPSYYNSNTPNAQSICCGVVESLSPATNTVNWRFYTYGNIRGSVTVIPGAVLFGDNDGNMYAVDIATGKQLFYDNFSDGIDGSISVAEGYVFVPTSLYGPTNATGLYAFTPEGLFSS